MRIAIVSTDGETVNEHFGRATRFLIYEVSGSNQTLVAVREVEQLSTGDKNHPFDPERLAVVLAVIKDCKRVYCTNIGDRPRQEMEKLGITAIIYTDTISSITV